MYGGDETKLTGDIEDGDNAIADHNHLIGMGKRLAGLSEVLPDGGFRDSQPMLKGSARVGMDTYCLIEKLAGDDSHEDMFDK
jgi:hypothetical protein